jgi:hypothetical protein
LEGVTQVTKEKKIKTFHFQFHVPDQSVEGTEKQISRNEILRKKMRN